MGEAKIRPSSSPYLNPLFLKKYVSQILVNRNVVTPEKTIWPSMMNCILLSVHCAIDALFRHTSLSVKRHAQQTQTQTRKRKLQGQPVQTFLNSFGFSLRGGVAPLSVNSKICGGVF